MFSVKINGFRSESEAREFVDWYESQGEQDAQIWFADRKAEGRIDRDFIGVDVQKQPVVENNTLTVWVIK